MRQKLNFALLLALLCIGINARAADSLKVTVTSGVSAIITSNTTGTTATTLQLTGTVYPISGSQTVTWSVLSGNTASGSVSAAGLLTVPAVTAGYIWIKAVSVADPTKADSIKVVVYCKPSHTNPLNWFNIDTVRVTNTTLNNGSATVGNAGAYTQFPESGSATGSIMKGNSYSIQTVVTSPAGPFAPDTTMYSYSVSAWIDFNRNGIFEASEWMQVEDSAYNRYASYSFTVPVTATAGPVMMRVRSRLYGGSNGVADMCLGITGSGQTEDYVLNIIDQPFCAGDPGLTPGDVGCVSFIYNGSTVVYPTVRGADGNIWLQKNLGAAQVATSSADADSYGDVFQWGRWADGHQSRTSTTSAAPAPNNPSGIGTGSANFYVGTPAWWSVQALTDTWNGTNPATDVTATNGCDPCKQLLGNGWHLPSVADWQKIGTAEGITSLAAALSSNLKLSANGMRSNTAGAYSFVGTRGYYWSNETASTGGKYVYLSNGAVPPFNPSAGGPRAQGAAIRCLRSTRIDSTKVSVLNNAPAAITTYAGTLQMAALVYPLAASQAVTWSLLPVTGNASITSAGLVSALTDGTVWAKATAVGDVTKNDSVLITITNQVPAIDSVKVKTLNNAAATITVNAGILQMVSVVYPAIASQGVTWSIVPVTGTAVISATGLLTAKADGTVWAKAVSVQDAAKKDSILVTISGQIVPIDSVKVQTGGALPATITVNAGTLQMTGKVYPATAVQGVTWSLVQVTGKGSISSAGLVTAIANGTVWAKATSVQDVTKTDSMLITISNQVLPIDSVVVTTAAGNAPLISTVGGTLSLQAVVYPAAAVQTVNWSIINVTGNASVTSAGVVAALTNGTVWAKATSAQDITKADSVLITISGQATGIGNVANVYGVKVYPNPATQYIYVQAGGHHPRMSVQLFDMTGQLLATQAIAEDSLNSPLSINVAAYSPGLYIIRLTPEHAAAQNMLFEIRK